MQPASNNQLAALFPKSLKLSKTFFKYIVNTKKSTKLWRILIIINLWWLHFPGVISLLHHYDFLLKHLSKLTKTNHSEWNRMSFKGRFEQVLFYFLSLWTASCIRRSSLDNVTIGSIDAFFTAYFMNYELQLMNGWCMPLTNIMVFLPLFDNLTKPLASTRNWKLKLV